MGFRDFDWGEDASDIVIGGFFRGVGPGEVGGVGLMEGKEGPHHAVDDWTR